jgi:hypothetical protein
LILTCGLPGAAKTKLAAQLAAERNAVRLTKDEWLWALGFTPWDEPTREKVEQQLWRRIEARNSEPPWASIRSAEPTSTDGYVGSRRPTPQSWASSTPRPSHTEPKARRRRRSGTPMTSLPAGSSGTV